LAKRKRERATNNNEAALQGSAPAAGRAPGRPRAPAGGPGLERCLEELVRGLRHSGVGKRVRGLVHRMNTPLQVLSFHLELLEQKAGEEGELLSRCPPPLREKLLVLRDYRGQKLRQFRGEVDKLRDFARRLVLQGLHEEAEERLHLDLNQVWREELEFYQAHPLFQHRVEKRFRFDPALPPIQGHYIDFSQSFCLLVDLALSAMEAAPRRVLYVETSLEKGGGGKGCRVLRVGDTGPPIPKELRPRIFEPFVVPRGTRDGSPTGLGLFLARRLLAPYAAQIQVDSRAGETWVTVRLPVGGTPGYQP